jgi:hypothetical protein
MIFPPVFGPSWPLGTRVQFRERSNDNSITNAAASPERGFDSIEMCCPSIRLSYENYSEPNAIGYAAHCSRSHNAVIRVYDDGGNVTETH